MLSISVRTTGGKRHPLGAVGPGSVAGQENKDSCVVVVKKEAARKRERFTTLKLCMEGHVFDRQVAVLEKRPWTTPCLAWDVEASPCTARNKKSGPDKPVPCKK